MKVKLMIHFSINQWRLSGVVASVFDFQFDYRRSQGNGGLRLQSWPISVTADFSKSKKKGGGGGVKCATGQLCPSVL